MLTLLNAAPRVQSVHVVCLLISRATLPFQPYPSCSATVYPSIAADLHRLPPVPLSSLICHARVAKHGRGRSPVCVGTQGRVLLGRRLARGRGRVQAGHRGKQARIFGDRALGVGGGLGCSIRQSLGFCVRVLRVVVGGQSRDRSREKATQPSGDGEGEGMGRVEPRVDGRADVGTCGGVEGIEAATGECMAGLRVSVPATWDSPPAVRRGARRERKEKTQRGDRRDGSGPTRWGGLCSQCFSGGRRPLARGACPSVRACSPTARGRHRLLAQVGS